MLLSRQKRNALTLLLLGGLLLTSCGDSDTGGNATDTHKTTDGETGMTAVAETETTERWRDALPEELDLGGAVITIHTRGGDDPPLEVNVEAEDGEVLHDAIYNRNRDIEERLNCTITTYVGAGWETYSDEVSKIRSSIAAGDNAWQIISGWGISIGALAFDNCFYDLQDMEYLDLSQPWWNQSAVNGLTLGGHTYFATGDVAVLTLLGGSYVLYQNDRIAVQFDIESIPQLVRDGKWTLDKMTSVTKQIYNDLNGDGTMDENDQYGYVTDFHNSATSMYVAADIHQIVVRDGLPEYVPQEEKLVSLMEKVYPLYYGGGEAGSYLVGDWVVQCDMFRAGQALLITRELSLAANEFRDVEDSYTILPYPKLDEAQENYLTNSYNGVALWGIPSDNPDPTTASAVMEAMAAESYHVVTPTYFETCLQDKFARNEDTLEMLEIIRTGSFVDTECLYGSSFGNTNYIIRDLIERKSSDVSSWIAKNKSKYQKKVDKTIEQIEASE